MRQSVSPLTGFSTPARIPLIPAILPSSNSIADALRPMSTPPAKDASGVKLCISEFSPAAPSPAPAEGV